MMIIKVNDKEFKLDPKEYKLLTEFMKRKEIEFYKYCKISNDLNIQTENIIKT